MPKDPRYRNCINLAGAWEKVYVGHEPVWAGYLRLDMGLQLEALYRGPKSGRLLAQTYSTWPRPFSRCEKIVGRKWVEIDQEQWDDYMAQLEIEPNLMED